MNLQKVYLEVTQKYFPHLSDFPLCRMSQGQLKDKRRAIIFGTYNARKNEIRIHPILLGENIPLEALEFVLYHELLHFEDRAYLLRRRKGEGVHTKSFHLRERAFPQFKEAKTALNKLFKEGVPKKSVLPKITLKGSELNQALESSLQRLEETLSRYGMSMVSAMKKQSRGAKND